VRTSRPALFVSLAAFVAPYLVVSAAGAGGAAVRPEKQEQIERWTRRAALAVAQTGDAVRQLRTLLFVGASRDAFIGDTTSLIPPIPSELRIRFPQDYLILRRDPHLQVLRAQGFTGDRALTGVTPTHRDVNTIWHPAPDQLRVEQERFVTLMLGILGQVPQGFPLHVRPVDVDERVPALRYAADPGFSVWVDLDKATAMPLKVRYQATIRLPKTSGRDAERRGAGQDESGRRTVMSAPPGPPTVAEMSISFQDRRVVNGLKLPYSWVRSASGVVLEEARFDKVIVNGSLSDKDFVR
jgi:hypothetical protein